MIRNKSDYKYVSIPDFIIIDGGIMPQRDVDGNDSWKILRGEDPAFITEAVEWKNYVVRHIDTPILNMNERVSGYYFRHAASEIEFLSRHMPKDSYDAPYVVESGNQYTWKICPNLRPFLNEHSSSSRDFGVNSPLVSDGCRKIFYDLGRMKNFYIDKIVSHTISNSEWSYKTIKYQGTAPTGGGWYVRSRANNDWLGKYYYIASANIDICEYVPTSWDRIKNIKVCYLNCEVRYTSSNSSWTRYYATRVDPVVLQSKIVIPPSSIEGVANTLMSVLGISIPMSYPSVKWESQTLMLTPLSMDFVYEIDDPTDFSEIGWSWSP